MRYKFYLGMNGKEVYYPAKYCLARMELSDYYNVSPGNAGEWFSTKERLEEVEICDTGLKILLKLLGIKRPPPKTQTVITIGRNRKVTAKRI